MKGLWEDGRVKGGGKSDWVQGQNLLAGLWGIEMDDRQGRRARGWEGERVTGDTSSVAGSH